MFGVIKKMFIVLSISICNTSNYKKCVSLSNQKCLVQPVLVNLHPNEYSRKLHYHLFQLNQRHLLKIVILLMTYLTKYVVKKTKDLNIHVFNVITEKMNQRFQQKIYHTNINVSLMKENVIQIKSGIMIHVDVSVKIIKYVE